HAIALRASGRRIADARERDPPPVGRQDRSRVFSRFGQLTLLAILLEDDVAVLDRDARGAPRCRARKQAREGDDHRHEALGSAQPHRPKHHLAPTWPSPWLCPAAGEWPTADIWQRPIDRAGRW